MLAFIRKQNLELGSGSAEAYTTQLWVISRQIKQAMFLPKQIF